MTIANDIRVPLQRHATARCKRTLISLAIGSLPALYAQAQDAGKPEGEIRDIPSVTVTGIKASLAKAQDIKQNAHQIVDSIVADDIGKLPDANVAEALQRITGVQISRDRGEGDRVQVRGLSQTLTLLNGRSIFTAGKERGLSFQDVPAELLAGADVYKTPTADQVEGGIGGIIDLRTRRPFDFSGRKAAATVKLTDAQSAKKDNLEGSLLLSDRWTLGSGSEIGALLSVAEQNRSYRTDTQELDSPAQLADGSGIYAPTGVWYAYELGKRDRTGITAALQYRPSDRAEYYVDTNFTRLKTRTNVYGFYGAPFWANYNAETNLGALYPSPTVPLTTSNGVFQKGSFYGASMTTSGYIADNTTNTTQIALGGRWKLAPWTVDSEVARTNSNFARLYQEARIGTYTNNPEFAYDLTTSQPSAYPVLANAGDLTNPAQYYANEALYFRQRNTGSENVFRADADRRFDESALSRVRVGVRYSDRSARSGEANTVDNIYNGSAQTNIGGALPSLASQIGVIPYNNLLSGAGTGTYPRQWLSVTNLDVLRDPAAFRGGLGLGVPDLDPLQSFDYSEKTGVVYGMAEFDTELAGKALSGNVGVRLVDTRIGRKYTAVNGASVTPVDSHSNQDDVLPSLNARLDLTDKLVARFAASKVLTLPDFDQLTPSLSLNANDHTGFQGNPELKPLKARQLDASLEYYINRSDHLYGAAFYKKVDGFIQTTSTQQTYEGSTYTVQTPSNGSDGTVKGLEAGYQSFFTSLPGLLRGLGVEANATYVDSSAPGPISGQSAPLQGLSRDSYNLVGIYDLGGFSLRVAYNRRGKYIADTRNYYPENGTVIAKTPLYMHGYGTTDAYMSYAINEHVKIALEGNNLTRTVRRSYYGIDNLPRGTYIDDRRFALSLHVDL